MKWSSKFQEPKILIPRAMAAIQDSVQCKVFAPAKSYPSSVQEKNKESSRITNTLICELPSFADWASLPSDLNNRIADSHDIDVEYCTTTPTTLSIVRPIVYILPTPVLHRDVPLLSNREVFFFARTPLASITCRKPCQAR